MPLCFFSSCAVQFSYPLSPKRPGQIQCYTETIRGVHKKFADNSKSCDDENILAVYTLSYHEGASKFVVVAVIMRLALGVRVRFLVF